MERKIMATLDWDIRPVTPHVVAYKILDELHGFVPPAVKRFAVNIVERIVVGSYCTRKFFDGSWDLANFTLTSLQFTLGTINASYFSPSMGSLETMVSRPLDWVLSKEQCIQLAEYPISYGDRIRLGDYCNV